MTVLKIRRMGDPILRQTAKRLTKDEIKSDKIQQLIADIKCTIAQFKDYGVGMSASQVGEDVAISVVSIKPIKSHPEATPFERVLINTEIIETFGEPTLKWEGCCSVGGPASKNLIYGKVPRYKKVRIKYLDEKGDEHEEIVSSFPAHVVQHETDHLNGILFVDKADPTSLMMGNEYNERIVKARKHKNT